MTRDDYEKLRHRRMDLFLPSWGLIRHLFVETKALTDLDEDTLVARASAAKLSSLDPWEYNVFTDVHYR